MDSARGTKADVLRYALDSLHIAPSERVIMVGDREHDVLGAKAVGLGCIGVLFGYGDRPELERAGAKAIAADVDELGRLLKE